MRPSLNLNVGSEQSESTPVIQRGKLLCYRMFDMADEIRLDEAERVLAAVPAGPGGKRVRLSRQASEYLVFVAPPLNVGLGRSSIEIPRLGRAVEAEMSARVYDYGAASVLFEISIQPGTRFA